MAGELKINIKEIAKRANVSVATVSYALNNSKEVSEKTRETILKLAKELNYTPNIAAKNLRTKKSRLICALTNNFGGTFNGDILQVVRNKFKEHGYQLMVVIDEIPQIIEANLFDGVILLNHPMEQSEIIRIATSGMPMVLLTNEVNHVNVSNVVLNNEEGIRQMMELYSKSPHKNIAFLIGHHSYNNQKRLESCQKYYKQYFAKDDFSERMYCGEFSEVTSYKLASQLMREHNYDAFFCFNDSMAMGCYLAAKDMGYSIGEDISISGFDDVSVSQFLTPSLSTVQIDKEAWGENVVQEYLKLRDKKQASNTIKIDSRLIIRNSVKL
ncbi:TPA: LacI family DNA-binding transcriptional regulator [Bacillus luti]|nr:LacI family DNA-binding transcriptional regulator [Bacillus luti]